MKKILYIKPSHPAGEGNDNAISMQIKEYLQSYADPGTTVDIVAMPRGPMHLEYEYYQQLAALEMLNAVKRAENQGYDGAIIGCFDDPALAAAREICHNMCVAGSAESSMGLAATLGSRFSVIVGRDKWIPRMRENVVKYGHQEHLASFRSLGLGVLDFQVDHQRTIDRMREETERAIKEDKAEVIILGCTMEFGFYTQLQKEFGVPVLDALICGLKHAEYLVGLKQTAGWYFSKAAQYAGPDAAEIRSWNIPADYGMGDLWDED